MKNVKKFSSGIAMLLFYLIFLAATPAIAQTSAMKTITGIVSDETGPIPGANVTVQGTTRQTQTDIDGKYSIQAAEGEMLVFSFIGMNAFRIKVGKSNVIYARLTSAGQELSEVVVTGSGVQRRNPKRKADKITSSYEVVKSEQLSQTAAPNTVQALQGRVAGVQIGTNSHHPEVIVRGAMKTTGSNTALIIIDGKIATSQVLESMPKDQIKDVQVVKGTQATALYGSEGVNGAIVIRTIHAPATLPQIVLQDEEEYDGFTENQFESPAAAPLSTFSIDVDNASYTNIRRFINNGQAVPKDAVRVEEMVNFFKYQYPQPLKDDPFSINTEYSGCPWNKDHQLLKIGLQGKIIASEKLPASNLVFLIDVSGSMGSQNRLPLVIESLKILLKELRAVDKVSIVVYAGAAGMVLPPTSGAEKETIENALTQLHAGGSTAGGAGIELAYKLATENFIKEGNNRVILATDGDFNVGISAVKDLETLIEEKRKSGVFLTCLGYGMGNYKDNRLETLADKGNGNYAYIDNIQEANRFLSKEFKGSMFAIAKDVKIQIEFNPKYVQNYRLIGYENRKLRAEDFNNDVIDAGELGSGHIVTALYEVIPVGIKSQFAANIDDLKFSNLPATSKGVENNQLAFIKFRYKKPAGDKSILIEQPIMNHTKRLDESSADFKFSASVAWFGLQLRDSKLIADKSRAALKALAAQGLANDVDGYKAEFIRLVDSGVSN
ncbi:MAG TPA: von Willebrand factor type A domain-containing protein [Flavobacterium sp.]|jgi:Ca-activated chloride channel family protein